MSSLSYAALGSIMSLKSQTSMMSTSSSTLGSLSSADSFSSYVHGYPSGFEDEDVEEQYQTVCLIPADNAIPALCQVKLPSSTQLSAAVIRTLNSRQLDGSNIPRKVSSELSFSTVLSTIQTTVTSPCSSQASSGCCMDTDGIVVILQQDDVLSLRKLIMRRRSTSPYQVKLPFATQRYAVRFAKSTRRSGSADAQLQQEQRPSSPSSPPPRSERTDATPTNDSEIPPLPSRPLAKRLLSTVSVIGTRPGPSQARAPLPPSATWDDICKDLSCAMEILAVLSDVGRHPHPLPVGPRSDCATTGVQMWPRQLWSRSGVTSSTGAAVDVDGSRTRTEYTAGFAPFASAGVVSLCA